MEYWLIYYKWRSRRTSDWVERNAVHKGPIGEWMEMALEQPEEWLFVNAVPINGESFEALKDYLT